VRFGHPKIRSAALFHVVTLPSSSIAT